MDLDEHHIWKEWVLLVGSSLELPSNLGMLEGSMVNIAGQLALWGIELLINWIKSRRLIPTIKVSIRVYRMVPETIPLDVTTGVE